MPRKSLNKISLFLIGFYRIYLSPFFGGTCRFTPSCSQYAKDAFENYGFLKAFRLSFVRLSKCHPFHSYGYDPIPQTKNMRNFDAGK